MTIPAFFQAANDPRVRRRALRVYLAVHGELDIRDYRAVKQEIIARKTGLSQSDVSLALRELCETGYLQAIAEKKFRAQYRLYYSCAHPRTEQAG